MTCFVPCRYVNQITVRDAQTGETWHFVCDKWLTPDDTQGYFMCRLTVTEVPKFTYAFRVRSLQNMRDQHTWMSIIKCPPHSTFTRMQRVSCAFAFIMTSMLVNIMFYGAGTDVYQSLQIVLEIEVDPVPLIIGTESALLAVPLNLLIVTIFRKVTPRRSIFSLRSGDEDICSMVPFPDEDPDNVEVAGDSDTSTSESTTNSLSESYSADKCLVRRFALTVNHPPPMAGGDAFNVNRSNVAGSTQAKPVADRPLTGEKSRM